MSHQGNSDDLLIDFDFFKHDNSETVSKQSSNVSTSGDLLSIENKKFEDETRRSMPFMSSTIPIYKLLSSDASNDVESNNPFDQMDKQAALLDDPFEIVENAVAHPIEMRMEINVETGTLISIDSPTNSPIDTSDILQNNDKSIIKNAKDAVQNISPNSSSEQSRSTPRKTSSTGKHRSKTRINSLHLLKYSLSNSRSDMVSENGSPVFSDDNVSTNETLQNKIAKSTTGNDSSTDDSFDDIWATKPNLIDSQTDMDIESDVDSDLAKLNIPMLSTGAEKKAGNEDLKQNSNTSPEQKKSTETKHSNRCELIEKLASIKLNNPSSPMQCSISLNHGQLCDQIVDMKSNQKLEYEDEPVTPKSHYSTIPQQHQVKPNNPDFLIEHLKKLVDQCDDINKQAAAKSLLDNLSSILDLNQKGENIMMKGENKLDSYKPQPIKREGTFNLDECGTEDITEVTSQQSNMVSEAYNDDKPDLSQVMKQIQSVLGTHQNINVLQTNMQTISQVTVETSAAIQPANPTYIVVMAQPPLNINNELILDDKDSFKQYPLRTRSQSLILKEKPIAASRASQNKLDQQPIEATPIRRLTLPRRSSFTAMTRPTFSKMSNQIESKQIKSTTESKIEPTSTFKRRTSLQLNPEPQSIPQKNINLMRRRSFQESPASRIRSPSPKTSIQNRITSGVGVTRCKSIHNEVVSKYSPQKVKTLHSMMKKPPVPPATRNLKIRVTQTMAGRSTAPLRATVPINHVASLLLAGEIVSPIEDYKAKSLITSTPRSILPSSTYALKPKKGLNA